MAKLNKLKPLLILASIVILAFALRVLWLKGNLFFGWEQGRDMLKLKEIVGGDLVLVGPKTDIDGVFHGVLSYYLPLTLFILGKGNPFFISIVYITLNSLAIIFLYKTAKDIANERVAVLASLFYAISYSAILYARWLSNPNLIPLLAILYLSFLVSARKKIWYLLPAAGVLVAMIHLLVVVPMTLLIPTLILVKKSEIKLHIKNLMAPLGILLAGLAPYFLFEIKNDFLMTKSLITHRTTAGNFIVSGISFLDQFFHEVIDGIFPASPRFAFLLFAILLFYFLTKVKSRTLRDVVLAFLFSVPLLFLFISDSPLRHFFIATPVFLAIFLGVVIDRLFEVNKRFGGIVLILLVIGNLYAYFDRIPQTKANFIHHAQRTYFGDMLSLIDWAYKDANRAAFTYDYYSTPYWKEDAWIYLFQWYGKEKYGYAPEVDRTNVDRTQIFYVFIEPNETAPIHQDNWYGEFKKGSKLLDTHESGKLKVEKRLILNEET